MKKRIGFIDLYINNWHANNYPAWFRTAKRAAEFELGYAYEETPAPGSPSLEDWCAKNGMRPAHDIETVVANSDCLCVLAPNNPEAHDRLAALPLAAGKPLYVDKTFAPDKATAARFFETARRHGTPLMSTSALRYGEEFVEMMGRFGQKRPVHVTATGGGRSFGEYSIHQIEMSRRPRPTTVRPITAPLRKAIFRPELRLRIVALAVRADAYVAVLIPT